MKNGRGGNRRGGAANQQINDLLASLSPLANANGLGYPGLSNAFALGPNGFGNGRGGPVMASANGYNLMGGNGMVAPSGPMPPVSRFLGVQWDERRDGCVVLHTHTHTYTTSQSTETAHTRMCKIADAKSPHRVRCYRQGGDVCVCVYLCVCVFAVGLPTLRRAHVGVRAGCRVCSLLRRRQLVPGTES